MFLPYPIKTFIEYKCLHISTNLEKTFLTEQPALEGNITAYRNSTPIAGANAVLVLGLAVCFLRILLLFRFWEIIRLIKYSYSSLRGKRFSSVVDIVSNGKSVHVNNSSKNFSRRIF